MTDEVIVSIVCNAYNHGKYIEDAIKGFIMQETTFKYEVLIHDDCSIDETAKIIKKYAEEYPDVINAVIEKDNQFSKGVKINRDIMFPLAKGKYIAMCEGDDYWIDPYKLQKQVDYMEKHDDCTFCFTNAKCEINGEIVKQVIPWSDDSVVLDGDVYDVDAIERINYIPTASFMFRKKSLSYLPTLRKGAFTGDGYLKLGLTHLGYAHYIQECTCVYRYCVPNSSTTKWKNDYIELKRMADRFIMMYEDFDSYFQGKYQIIRDRVTLWEINKAFATGEFKNIKGTKYKSFYKNYQKKGYCIYLVATTFPRLYILLRNIKNR